MDKEPCANPEVALMLSMVCVVKAPQYQVVVCNVPGVPNGDILEQMEVHSTDVVCLGLHLLAKTDHAPLPTIPGPREMVGM